jgi:tripartite-type tricarboxylate transporter receptor subunit TctC
MSGALRASLADAGLQEKFTALDTQAAPMSSVEMQAFIEREEKNWIPVVRGAGLEMQ